MKVRRFAILTILLVLCGMVFAGCWKNDVKSPENNVIPTDTPEKVINEAPTDNPEKVISETPTDTSEEIIKEGTIEKNGNVVLKQLAFVYHENAIAISDIVDDEKIEKLLGKADKIISHTYSKEDGLNMDQLDGMTEKQYQFPGLVIKTLDATEDKKHFIFNIKITDPKYPTVRNIKVGDSFERLKEAYPEGALAGGELGDEEDDFRYEPVNYVDVMSFHIKDKKIESILIYKLID